MMRKLRALIQQPSFTKQTDFVIKGVPEKKYLSEISGPQIHVTIKGQTKQTKLYEMVQQSITVQIIQMAQ